MKQLFSILLAICVFVTPVHAYWFSDGELVYVTPSGGCYHQDVCGYVGDEWTELEYEHAVSMGYRACSWCVEEYTDEWEQYGDWLWYNPYVEQWRDEDGYLYGDPSEAYEAFGYSYFADGDVWVGDDGYLVDGEYQAYPEDVPDYCNDCENIIEDRDSDHDEDCVNNPNYVNEFANEESVQSEENSTTMAEKISEFMEEQSIYAFLGVFGIPLLLYLFNKYARKVFDL